MCTEWLYRYSVLPALCVGGIIWLNIVEGSFDGECFATFIQGLLQQMNDFPLPHSVIVMDNCRIHKSEEIWTMIEARYVLFTVTNTLTNEYCPAANAWSFFPPIARISAILNPPSAGSSLLHSAMKCYIGICPSETTLTLLLQLLPTFINTFLPSHQSLQLRGSSIVITCRHVVNLYTVCLVKGSGRCEGSMNGHQWSKGFGHAGLPPMHV